MEWGVLMIKICCFICCFFAFPFVLSAKSLPEILPLLLNQHELVKAAEARRDASLYNLKQVRAGRFPRIDLQAEAGREEIDYAGDAQATSVKKKNTVTLTAEELVTDFGRTGNLIKQARAAYEQAKAELEAVRQQVMYEGSVVYLNLLKIREQLKYAKKSEQRIKELTGMEEVMLKKGAGVSSDVLQVKARLAGAMALRVRTQGDFILARNKYKSIFKSLPDSKEIETYIVPENAFDKLPVTLEEAINWALKKNPRVLMARQEVLVTQKAFAVQRSAYFPRLVVFGQALRKENDAGISGVRMDNVLGMKLTYNLFSGGSDMAAVKAANARIVDARKKLENIKATVEEQVRDAWQNLLTYKENCRLLQNQADIVKAFLKLAKKERKIGTRTLLDVLAGEVDFINAQSSAVASEVDTIIAAYNLYYAMGRFNIELF
jgi:adhesin transport system outer membrane protein